MTELNTAYRNDLTNDDDDPLAELARIVSGEPSKAEKADPSVELEVVGSNASNGGFDIENELLKELGETPGGSAMPSGSDDTAADLDFEISDDAFAAELAVETGSQAPAKDATEAVSNSEQSADHVSLEDQLMAELEGGVASDQPDTDGHAIAQNIDPVSETDPIVDETVTNAMRDVELASESLDSKSDAGANPFDVVVEKSAELRDAAIDNIPEAGETPTGESAEQAGSLDDFFADGFSDLLQEEMATSDQLSQPAADTAEADFDFAEAFSRQLEADAPAAQPAVLPEHVEPVQSSDLHQDELALENDFAKAFASELAGDEPVFASEISRGHEAQPGDGTVYHEPQSAFDDRFEPEHASLAPEIAGVNRRSGNGFKLAVGALICALVVGLGVVGWGYYSGQGDGSEPAVIKADTSPAKVKPADPGGEEIANQDNEVYNQVAGTTESEPRQEELISSRQQPVEIKPKADSRLSPNNESASSETAPLGLSPKRVKTLTVKPDGTIISSDGEVAATAQETTAASGETASMNSPSVNADAESSSGGIIGIDGATATGKLAVPEPSPLPAARELALTPVETPAAAPIAAPTPTPVAASPKPAAPKPATPADANAPTQIASLDNAPAPTPVVTSSEWKVQVSSQRSREAAEASFNNLQRRFSSILAGRSASIERADIEGKGTFYRAKVLADSKSEAGQICTRLKSAGGSCFVTR